MLYEDGPLLTGIGSGNHVLTPLPAPHGSGMVCPVRFQAAPGFASGTVRLETSLRLCLMLGASLRLAPCGASRTFAPGEACSRTLHLLCPSRPDFRSLDITGGLGASEKNPCRAALAIDTVPIRGASRHSGRLRSIPRRRLRWPDARQDLAGTAVCFNLRGPVGFHTTTRKSADPHSKLPVTATA